MYSDPRPASSTSNAVPKRERGSIPNGIMLVYNVFLENPDKASRRSELPYMTYP